LFGSNFGLGAASGGDGGSPVVAVGWGGRSLGLGFGVWRCEGLKVRNC